MEGKSTACKVLGIVSIPTGSLPCAIVALVFASQILRSYEASETAQAKARTGKTCAIVGIILGVAASVIFSIIYIVALMAELGSLRY